MSRRAESLDQATRILEQLVRDFPQVPDYRFDLCQSYAMIDMRPHDLSPEDPSAAELRILKALALSEELTADHPQVAEYLASQAQIHHKLTAVLLRSGRHDEAEQSERKALLCQQKLVERAPDVVPFRIWLSAFRTSLADVLLTTGKLDEAKDQLQNAARTLDDLLGAHPEMWYLHGPLMGANETLAGIFRQAGRDDLASRAATQAEQHRQQFEKHLPPRPPGLRPGFLLPGLDDGRKSHDHQFLPWTLFGLAPDAQPAAILRPPEHPFDGRW